MITSKPTPVLQVRRLVKTYPRRHGLLRAPEHVYAVRSVSFDLDAGGVLCLVGESGSGKSTIGKLVAGVVAPTSGTIALDGQDIEARSRADKNRATLSMQIIHQDPFAALNPTRTIGQSLSAPLAVHRLVERGAAREARLREVMTLVGLPPDADLLSKYPHQLSGGQRQRVVIARALVVNPRVLVADEATSMVDVSLRVGILRRLRELALNMGIATLFITHDFGVARYFAYGHSIAVMYLGEFIETGPTESVIGHPHHPYTAMLLSAVPLPNPIRSRERHRLLPVSDTIPDASRIVPGCSFADRCPFATDICRAERPPLRPVDDAGHHVSCHHADDVAGRVASVRPAIESPSGHP